MESNKEAIEKQAKEILDKFAKALDNVESKEIETGVDRVDFERTQGKSKDCSDKEFKSAILENAPAFDDDFILTEKGDFK
jgi:Asp-tRNA(Asn)/Glu-tRNA(Gln) amidotransferase C subunit